MNFKDNRSEIPPNSSNPSAESVNQETRQKVENFVRPQVHELLEHAVGEPDKKSFIIDQIATLGRRIFQGQEHILEEALTNIGAAPYATDEELEESLVTEFINAVLAFVASSGFSEQDAKRYFRRFMYESTGFVPLDNDGVFSYSRFENKINLHITEGLTPKLFQGAMSALARIVRQDESIEIIKITSWVVAEYSPVIRRYGFTLDEPLSEKELAEIRADLLPEMRDKPIAEAHMTREEFLAKYGVEK